MDRLIEKLKEFVAAGDAVLNTELTISEHYNTYRPAYGYIANATRMAHDEIIKLEAMDG